jgi:hypothetical protein
MLSFMNNANTAAAKTTYTVTLVIADGIEITSKEVFSTREEARGYIGRDVVSDDGSINVKGMYRINELNA